MANGHPCEATAGGDLTGITSGHFDEAPKKLDYVAHGKSDAPSAHKRANDLGDIHAV